MAGPLGVLAACLTVATIKVEDIDDGPPGGCWWHVRQRPPLKLKPSMAGAPGECCRYVRQRPPPKLETPTVGPLGGVDGMFSSGHHLSWRRRRWAP
jgi:hypothetical protein